MDTYLQKFIGVLFLCYPVCRRYARCDGGVAWNEHSREP